MEEKEIKPLVGTQLNTQTGEYVALRIHEGAEKTSCEVWGHYPEPVIDKDDEVVEMRCQRCKRPMHNDNT